MCGRSRESLQEDPRSSHVALMVIVSRLQRGYPMTHESRFYLRLLKFYQLWIMHSEHTIQREEPSILLLWRNSSIQKASVYH